MVFTCLLASACAGTGPTPASDTTAPVLSVTPVDLTGPFDPTTHLHGSLLCDNRGFSDYCFRGMTADRVKPASVYKVRPGTPVRAVARALVRQINLKSTNDYEVFMQATEHSVYWIAYDHVINVSVSVGAWVNPGQAFAEAGQLWAPGEMVTELQINKNDPNDPDGTSGRSEYVCPRDLGSPQFNQLHADAVATNNSTFPSFPTSECSSPNYFTFTPKP